MKNIWLALLITLSCSSFAAVQTSAGEFQSDIDKAFASAKKKKKPMLIDFYGIWCPPCNQMNETVFVTPNFLQKAKSFELLAVDADKKESWAIKNKYHVGGYPTYVFTTPEGEEIYRVVGYRDPKEFSKVMDLVLSAKSKPAAKACSSKNTEDLWRCALTCMETKNKPCATKALNALQPNLKPGTARYEIAQMYFADESENVDLKKKGYETLLTNYPDSPGALAWGLAYLDANEEQKVGPPKKELVEKALSHYPTMAKDGRLEEIGFTETDLAELRAELLGKLDKGDEAKKAWGEAADLLAKKAAELPKGVSDRGYMIERISCLDLAGKTDEALKLAEQYQAKYPSEFTFHFIAAGVLEKKKRYSEAIPIAQKAYEVSYGDNKIRAANLLLTLYTAVPNKEAARQVYQAVKKDIQPDAKLEVRTHRYLKKLDEAWSRLEKSS